MTNGPSNTYILRDGGGFGKMWMKPAAVQAVYIVCSTMRFQRPEAVTAAFGLLIYKPEFSVCLFIALLVS